MKKILVSCFLSLAIFISCEQTVTSSTIDTVSEADIYRIALELQKEGYKNSLPDRRDCGYFSLLLYTKAGGQLILQNQDNSSFPDGYYSLTVTKKPVDFPLQDNQIGGIYIWKGVKYIAYPKVGWYNVKFERSYKSEDKDPHAFNYIYGAIYDLTRGTTNKNIPPIY